MPSATQSPLSLARLLNHHETIISTSLHENEVTSAILDALLATSDDGFVGLGAAYDKQCRLERLSFATLSHLLVIRFTIPKKPQTNPATRQIILRLNRVLGVGASRHFLAFDGDRLAVGLFLELGVRVQGLVSLQSVFIKAKTKSISTFAAIFSVLEQRVERPGRFELERHKLRDAFDERAHLDTDGVRVGFRAWAAVFQHMRHARPIASAERINTTTLSSEVLNFAAKVLRDADRLESVKPPVIQNDFRTAKVNKQGDLEVILDRFKTRTRRTNDDQHVRIKTIGGQTHASGRTTEVEGRKAIIVVKRGKISSAKVHSITTHGKENPTSCEEQQRRLILRTLQGNTKWISNPIVQQLWFNKKHEPSATHLPLSPISAWVNGPLNDSQHRVVVSMFTRIPTPVGPLLRIVQGPPGTGKTRTIAAFVQVLTGKFPKEGCYLAAQSNVAVKNIAEKLAGIRFKSWRLIVSHEFHFDWHDSLYDVIRPKVIEASNLPSTMLEMERLFNGVNVILCTLSMLSTPMLAPLTRLIPVNNVVFDEASQIQIGNYLPAFDSYTTALKRVCFVGDDKQLPPFGQDRVPGLTSVFEIGSFRKSALFLDTQYRMPVPIGNFLSRRVYDSKLKSQHLINTPSACLKFIDVSDGEEVSKGGNIQNPREVQVAIHCFLQLHRQGKKCCILTGYDAQRNALQRALKATGLSSGISDSTVFNVDSYQGNEEDYVIVSLVRTKTPGFLSDPRRTNVMLSRCKKGMVILAKRSFLLEPKAERTLVAMMTREIGGQWMDWRRVLEGHTIFG